ncbi:MAG TPA: ATP-dependent helicase HrpB [Bacteroidia bacterium]|nr:ATP-dependent helicase HrpB [Bacteroidia bacterium]
MSLSLPIEEVLEEVKSKLASHNTVILQAPPGAGKSTWLPVQLLNEPWLNGKKIVMLEPRRLAARTVAARLAFQVEEETGETVGYRIRFEKKVSARTRVEILTEGILTRMLHEDGALEEAGLVIFDEFHERSLHADLALAFCLEVQKILRPDLRILIMSATLDGEKLSRLLGDAPVITSAGRQHPVSFHYTGYDDSLPLPLEISKIIRRALQEEEGDILAFLPGTGEIMRCAEILGNENVPAKVVPLYGDLSMQKQQEAIQPDPYGARKVVLATSLAETSLTIEGIRVVVDSGFSRVPRFDPSSGLTKLTTVRVTRDSAEQRAGRAGRLGPGVCYRMWTEGFHHHLVPHRSPEILEADLAPLTLDLAGWGTKDIASLTWLSPPPAGAIAQAKELLEELGATAAGKITERGKEMLRLPAHPRIAHMLLEGKKENLAALATDLAALLEERDPFTRESSADIVLRIEALRKFRSGAPVPADKKRIERIERSAAVWRNYFRIGPENNFPAATDAGKLIALAYPERIAKKEHELRYRLSGGRMLRLKEHDPLASEEYIAVASLDAGTKGEGKIFLAAALDPDDLLHLAYEKKTIAWDAQKGELIARTEKRIGGLILETKPLKDISAEEKTGVLIAAIREGGTGMLNFNEEFLSLQARTLSLRKWREEETWPDLSTEHLFATLEEWLAPYLENVKKKDDLFRLNLHDILLASVSYDQQQRMEKLLPQKIGVPSGSLIKIEYHADGSPPVLAVRLQELFGMSETPKINEGRTKLMIHLLSPAYRPVQVTQDLASFWKNTYAEVRKELRMRYPKHSWPEDPLTAEAVRGAKRKNRS